MVWLKCLVFCVLLVGFGATQNTEQWFDAAESGDSVKMEKYLASKYWKNISMTDNGGNTALHRAVKAASDEKNVTEVVKLLIDAGINVNSKDNTGQTALFAAASKLDQELVQQLIAAGADTEIEDLWGYTAFQWAANRHERKKNSTSNVVGVLPTLIWTGNNRTQTLQFTQTISLAVDDLELSKLYEARVLTNKIGGSSNQSDEKPLVFAPELSDWSEGSCSCACGPGTRTDVRTCTYYVYTGEGKYKKYVEAKNNENPCGENLSRTFSCREKTCVINSVEVVVSSKPDSGTPADLDFIAWYGSTFCSMAPLARSDVNKRWELGATYLFDNYLSSPAFPLSCHSLCLPRLDSVLSEIQVVNKNFDGFRYHTVTMKVNGYKSRVYNSGGVFIEYDPDETTDRYNYKKSAYRA